MKWVVAVVAAIVLLTIAAVAAIPRLVDVPRVQALVAGAAAGALGRPVRFSSLSVSLFPLPAVTLHKLEVAEDPQFGTAPFLTLDSGRLRLRLRPLLRGRVEFAELVLDKPVISVIRGASGRLNIATLGASRESRPAPRPARPSGRPSAPSAPLALPTAARITDATVIYSAGAAAARYRVEGLDLTLESAGSQITFRGRGRLVPGAVGLTITDGTVSVGPSHTMSDAPLRATVGLESRDVTELVAAVAGPSPSVAGALKGTLAVAGTVGAPTAAGDVTLSSLTIARVSPRCPEPRRRTLSIPSLALAPAWRAGQLTAERLQAALPKGTVTGRLALGLGRDPRVRLDDLAVKGVPVESVLVDFLCQGYAVSGPLDLSGAVAFTMARPLETLSGPGSFRIGAGKVVGQQALTLIASVVRVGGSVSSLLSADLPASAFASPVEFDSITGTYQIRDGVARTRDLVYTSRAMAVAVAGDYALASGAMNLDVVVSHARGEVRAAVTGTTAAPSIRVVPASVLRNVDREQVRSGLEELLRQFR